MHNLLNRNRNANYFHNQIYLFTLVSFEIQAVLTLQEVCCLKLMHIRTVQLEDCQYIKKSDGTRVVEEVKQWEP